MQDYKDLKARIYDWIERANRTCSIVYTPFLVAQEVEELIKCASKQVHLEFDGGCLNANMKIVAIVPEYTNDQINFPLVKLHTRFAINYTEINHRDVLGAIMNSGIKREHLGDIIVEDNNIYVIAKDSVAEFIMNNVTKIKRTAVKFKTYEQTITNIERIEYMQKIVSSYRLDVIVASITNCSRKEASELIISGLVKVEHQVNQQTTTLLKEGCSISIRGYGRFILGAEKALSKKSNYIIEIGKYC
ncbi:MAG: YlmH/Sll1252 family protein [Erysipelotrichaceae bacterium]